MCFMCVLYHSTSATSCEFYFIFAGADVCELFGDLGVICSRWLF